VCVMFMMRLTIVGKWLWAFFSCPWALCMTVIFLCSAWLSVVKRAGCMAPLILVLSVLTAAVLIIYFEHVPTTCLHGGLYFVQFNVWLFDARDCFLCTVTSVLQAIFCGLDHWLMLPSHICYLRQGGYVVVIVCFYVCLLATFCKNFPSLK